MVLTVCLCDRFPQSVRLPRRRIKRAPWKEKKKRRDRLNELGRVFLCRSVQGVSRTPVYTVRHGMILRILVFLADEIRWKFDWCFTGVLILEFNYQFN